MAYMSHQQVATLKNGQSDSVWNISMQPGWSSVELDLLKLTCPSGNTFVVDDDCQSINQWKGVEHVRRCRRRVRLAWKGFPLFPFCAFFCPLAAGTCVRCFSRLGLSRLLGYAELDW